ncbi:MAG: hypothetical protein E6Q31_08560 [Aquabacterium sp.]|nr:MAG: hypothetical protein E6Q31_08560 [Aquabacterium sp.]
MWGRLRSINVLLVLANLASRAFGFLVSLLLARMAGVQVLGAYSSLQISSSAPTSPMSLPLANSATIIASAHAPGLGLLGVLRAYIPVLWPASLLALFGGALLVWLGHGAGSGASVLTLRASLLTVVVLAVAQLWSQVLQGLFHGAGRSLECAQAIAGTMVTAIVLCGPVVLWFGIQGALVLAVWAAAGPAVWLCWRLRLDGSGLTLPASHQQVSEDVWRQVRISLPSVVSTVIRNGTSWFCCIYLARLHFGEGGVGLVTIGLQWMMLMQLPVSSWGGRMVSEMAEAQREGQTALRGAQRHWLRKSGWVTAVVSAGVLVCTPALAWLYRLDTAALWWLLLINSVGSCLAALAYVQERIAFCIREQRAWMLLSLGADVVQLLMTLMWASVSVYVIPLGSVVSSALLLLGAQYYLSRCR